MAGKKTTKGKTVKKTASKKKEALSDSHPGHSKHLCHITSTRKMKTVAKLAKDAKYICHVCGRAAKSEKNLCSPLPIKFDFF